MVFVGANDGVVGRFFVACLGCDQVKEIHHCAADILQLVLNVWRCQFFHPTKEIW